MVILEEYLLQFSMKMSKFSVWSGRSLGIEAKIKPKDRDASALELTLKRKGREFFFPFISGTTNFLKTSVQ